MRVLLIAALCGFLFAACGSHHRSSTPAPPQGVVSQTILQGSWAGQTNESPLKSVSLALVHDGLGPVSGTWRRGTAGGTVSGSVSGNSFTFVLTETSPCQGSYSGSATVSGSAMSGSFSGSDCGGGSSGTFDVSR